MGGFHDILQYFEGVVEVVLMFPSVARFHDVEIGQFGQDERQQTATMQVHPPLAGVRRHHHFVQFIGDALATDDFNALGIALQGIEGFFLDEEIQLGGKTDASKHAQGIVAERDVGVERGANDAVLQVVESVKGVYQFAKAPLVETNGHRVDGEVAAVLVVL